MVYLALQVQVVTHFLTVNEEKVQDCFSPCALCDILAAATTYWTSAISRLDAPENPRFLVLQNKPKSFPHCQFRRNGGTSVHFGMPYICLRQTAADMMVCKWHRIPEPSWTAAFRAHPSSHSSQPVCDVEIRNVIVRA